MKTAALSLKDSNPWSGQTGADHYQSEGGAGAENVSGSSALTSEEFLALTSQSLSEVS